MEALINLKISTGCMNKGKQGIPKKNSMPALLSIL
jgi:hypothetical protein